MFKLIVIRGILSTMGHRVMLKVGICILPTLSMLSKNLLAHKHSMLPGDCSHTWVALKMKIGESAECNCNSDPAVTIINYSILPEGGAALLLKFQQEMSPLYSALSPNEHKNITSLSGTLS